MNYPIYLTNMNRLSTTKKMVEDLFRLNPKADITIIDNASTYPPLLKWYEEVKNDIKIERLDANHGPWVFFYGGIFQHCKQDYYAYSDADLELNPNMPPEWQEIMFDYHQRYGKKCSLVLRTDDIEDPARKAEIEAHYNLTTCFHPSDEKDVYTGVTDMHFSFDAKQSGYRYDSVRLAGDFMCRHIPWYNNFDNLSEEELYFLSHLPEDAGPVFWTNIARNECKKRDLLDSDEGEVDVRV